MALYKSIIAYDGTEFRGFQRQAAGLRTVQGEFERALRTLGWQGASLSGAGRTDAGVHARGQVVTFKMTWRHSEEDLSRALNACLPKDLAVWSTEPVPESFHPRRSALRRRYVYTMLYSPRRDPLRERYAWRLWPEPDLGALQRAADMFVGSHDFGAFGNSPTQGGHTRREIFRADWQRQADTGEFLIEGNAFLYRMVRRLVAIMQAVGSGRLESGQIAELLAQPTKRWEGDVAPACGLCLGAVIYETESKS